MICSTTKLFGCYSKSVGTLKWNWAGNVYCIPTNQWTTITTEWSVVTQYRRQRGRSRQRWEKQVGEERGGLCPAVGHSSIKNPHGISAWNENCPRITGMITQLSLRVKHLDEFIKRLNPKPITSVKTMPNKYELLLPHPPSLFNKIQEVCGAQRNK